MLLNTTHVKAIPVPVEENKKEHTHFAWTLYSHITDCKEGASLKALLQNNTCSLFKIFGYLSEPHFIKELLLQGKYL